MVARKTSEAPARVWKYGLPFGPNDDDDENVSYQLFRANRAYHSLLEIALDGRHRYRDARSRHVPGYAAAEREMERLKDLKREVNEQINEASAGTSKRAKPTQKQKAKLAVINAELKEARKAFAPLKEAAKTHEGLLLEDTEIKAATKAATKQWRKDYGDVAPGTRDVIDASIRQAMGGKTDPHHKRWAGDGYCAVQIKAGEGTRLFTEGLLACKDTRARLEIHGGKPKKRRATLWLRIGSEGIRKTPVWARFPLLYHRDLPSGGELKSVRVQRRRIAPGRWLWEACFQLESMTFVQPDSAAPKSSSCFISTGWWPTAGGGLCVARVYDGHRLVESVDVPASVIHRLGHAATLKSLRDTKMTEVRTKLLAWRKEFGGELPEAHAEAFTHMHKWKSPGRMFRLARHWAANRIDGDDEAFEAIDAWRKREVHLYQYEAGERLNALGHRQHVYRNAAVSIAKRFGKVELQQYDLKRAAEKPRTGKPDPLTKQQRHDRFVAAPSYFKSALQLAVSNHGGELTIHKPLPLEVGPIADAAE